jgi:hypothetical protein
MKPSCMRCGQFQDAHIENTYCAKQFISRAQWLKFEPAFIPRAPAGWTRSTWTHDVHYRSRAEKISVTIPIKNFLRSRNPKEVLWLAIRAKRG